MLVNDGLDVWTHNDLNIKCDSSQPNDILMTYSAMFVPIILGSDKTTVLVATCHTEYYTVYLSFGNLHNNIHWSHHGRVALIAFLTIAKSECVLLCFYSFLALSNLSLLGIV
jgi:hypothetical protein